MFMFLFLLAALGQSLQENDKQLSAATVWITSSVGIIILILAILLTIYCFWVPEKKGNDHYQIDLANSLITLHN